MPENLYQQNTDILKGFFKKPIVLITSIVIFATIVANFLIGIFAVSSVNFSQLLTEAFKLEGSQYVFDTSDANFSYDVPVISILVAVAFLLFFIFSRRPDGRLNGPATLYKVLAIIQLVIACVAAFTILVLLFLIIAFLAALDSGYTSFNPAALSIIILPVFIVLIVLMLIEAISRTMFASSIKKSLKNIYLYRNGAQTYGVIQFIFVGLSIILAVIIFALAQAYAKEVSNLSLYVSDISKYTNVYTDGLNLCGIALLINIPTTFFSGLLAVMYSSYIKNMSQNFTVPAQQQPIQQTTYQPVQQPVSANPYAPQQPAAQNPYEPQQYAQPAPQQYDAQPAPAPQYEPQAVFCTNCGKQLNPDDYFCNNCGTPVQK